MNISSVNYYSTVQYQETVTPQGRAEDFSWKDDGNFSYIDDSILTYCDEEDPDDPHPVVRVVKRRNTANRKERRRTQSINNAFADLRDCIPAVPADTKLSKIKTLRLAISYISYLMGVLENEDSGDGFKADLALLRKKNNHVRFFGNREDMKKSKGRTGWPQHVWALELKQESV
ncbi:heart- and neural crest derivatives-expressed protein 2-like isoform X1 [Cimex lectularius]|uniref:BHLH domain-containing protein n=1 Tax=Cimex lectularius TaxID=79782 RepID=A0A8I6RRU2_CIMLE|nr:heart- and neural crest derivatives-expressed protein 2-like isoform X1 [Cimex lectularius]